MYAGLTIADKPALLDAKARGAEWVIAQWGGKAFGYKEKPKREEITDECCYGSYFEWSAQDGDYEIELGSMPHPLVSYQNTEPVNIDLALAQIAEMEREQTANYVRVGDVTVEVGLTTSTPRTNQNAMIEKMRDVREAARLTITEHRWERDGVVQYGYRIAGSLMRGYVIDLDYAIERQIEYLLSPAEDGK